MSYVKQGLNSSTLQRRRKMMETSFKLGTHFEGSQSLTEVWLVQILILLNDTSKLGKLTSLKNHEALV